MSVLHYFFLNMLNFTVLEVSDETKSILPTTKFGPVPLIIQNRIQKQHAKGLQKLTSEIRDIKKGVSRLTINFFTKVDRFFLYYRGRVRSENKNLHT